MSIFNFPFKRKQYEGIDNPRFVSDIVAANELTLDGLKAICGLGLNDFAIISGFDFIQGVQNSYNPGIFYLAGKFYLCSVIFNENLYLSPSTVNTLTKAFSNGTTKEIYELNQALPVSVSLPINTPIFSGNMNSYRISNIYLSSVIKGLQSLISTFGNSAFATIGSLSGNVMPGDFAYSKIQTDAAYALISKVIQIGNSTTFTPTLDYEPSTKKYVDDSLPAFKPVLHGRSDIQNASGQANISVPISLGITLNSSDYIVVATIETLGTPTLYDNDLQFVVRSKTANSFELYVNKYTDGGSVNFIISWILFK